MQGNPLVLKDNYSEQMKRLQAMCEDEGLAEQEVTLALTFAYQGLGRARPHTLAMKDRIEAALEEFGLVYTMIQDLESTFSNPIFVLFLVGPTHVILDFYEAVGDY